MKLYALLFIVAGTAALSGCMTRANDNSRNFVKTHTCKVLERYPSHSRYDPYSNEVTTTRGWTSYSCDGLQSPVEVYDLPAAEGGSK